tara:strand:- start:1277 stop:1411 length:135 start_codon:yes stop_codon:yes gene_type:complete
MENLNELSIEEWESLKQRFINASLDKTAVFELLEIIESKIKNLK